MSDDTVNNKVTLETIRELIEKEACAIRKHLEKQDSNAKRDKGIPLALLGMTIILSGVIFGMTGGNFYFCVVGFLPLIVGVIIHSKVGKKSKGKQIAIEQKNIANTKSDE